MKNLLARLTSPSPKIQVQTSSFSRSKALQLERYQSYSRATGVWGKDEKLLRSNLLHASESKTYAVLLAFGPARHR